MRVAVAFICLAFAAALRVELRAAASYPTLNIPVGLAKSFLLHHSVMINLRQDMKLYPRTSADLGLRTSIPAMQRAAVVAAKPRWEVVVAVLKEVPPEGLETEACVCVTPENAKSLLRDGARVVVQSGAGVAAGYTDAAYIEAGAQVAMSVSATLAGWKDFLKDKHGDELNPPTPATHLFCINLNTVPVSQVRRGLTIISHASPAQKQDVVDKLKDAFVNFIALGVPPQLSSSAHAQASTSYSTDVQNFYKIAGDKDYFFLDKADNAVRKSWVLHETEGELEQYTPEMEEPNVVDVDSKGNR